MSYQRQNFDRYFLEVLKAKQASLNSYNVSLRKVDSFVSGLDEYIQQHGGESLIKLLLSQREAFAPYDSNVRSAVRTYLRFLDAPDTVATNETADEASAEETRATVFKYENELQGAVRAQLERLEKGLKEADDGAEMVLPTGRPDIVARDSEGRMVVIELKAGPCPRGAIEQALGYATDIDELDPDRRCRVVVVASEFSSRQIAAARRIPDLTLKAYKLAVDFEEVS